MSIFQLTLGQMLLLFTLLLAGVILCKAKILPEGSDTALSRLETYLLIPALYFYTFMNHCTVRNFAENAHLLLYGSVICVVFILLAYPLSLLFVKQDGSTERAYLRNVYKYAATFGNYGFVGNCIVLGIWGEEVFFQYSMFTFPLSVLGSTWGLYVLIPKDAGKTSLLSVLKKGLLTPPVIALVLGALVGLFGIAHYVPSFFVSAMSGAGDCMGPVAMVLSGFVIGRSKLSGLFGNVKVYVLSLLRLIALPAALSLILLPIKADSTVLRLALIAFATPIGMNTIVYPSAYGGDSKTGASMVLVSSILSLITIPIMCLIFL
ncbi:MAG: AEC family transporter [Clostridia bacterium]|nr:AEC family transporter [Clostridia bacterium]